MTEVPLFPCTQEKWDQFFPPDAEAVDYLEALKNENESDVKDSFLCLDLSKENSTLKPNY